MSKLSTTVSQWRRKKGLSQEKLARLANVSNNTIINIENGKNINPTTATLKKISAALNIAADKLL